MRNLLFVLALLFGVTPSYGDSIELSSLQVFLIYSDSGKLSKDILAAKPPIILWNTIIGEGGAGGPSDDVLLVAHFKRQKNSKADPKIGVRVAAKGGKTLLGQDHVSLSFLDGDQAAKAFILQGVTCRDITVEVTVAKASFRKNINFECGE